MTLQFADMTSSSIFFEVDVFLFWSLVTDPSFMSILWLVLELAQFLFINDWPEIWKSEIPPSEFWQISGDWDELGIPHLARMSLIKSYWTLKNARVTTFAVSELFRKNQLGGGVGGGGGGGRVGKEWILDTPLNFSSEKP